MNRNLKKRPKEAQRFNRSNPPPNKEEALARLAELDGLTGRIETQLDHMSPDSFPNDKDYKAWRYRATIALGFARAERKFLEQWLDGARAGSERPELPRKTHRDLAQIEQRIKVRARKLADEIGRNYTPIYTGESQLESRAIADQRLAQVVAVKCQIQAGFTEITAAWTEHPLSRNTMPAAKAPLAKILAQAEAEIAVLKEYIRTHPAIKPSRDWKPVCYHALERAIAGGFQLTPDEQIVFEQLKALQTLYGPRSGV